MSDTALPNENQQKLFAAANLSTLAWMHDMTEHGITAQLDAYSPTVNRAESAAKILGIELKKPYSGDESKVNLLIYGEENLKKLAAAGGKFPGSDIYAMSAKDKWVNAV